jgi:multidrug efflux pump subunit AcrB
MRGIIDFFLKNTVAANLLMVFILIMGLFSYQSFTSSFFPERSERLITIQLVYPGASPEEMEEGVVNKIEENLEGVPNIKETSSTSSENSAVIIVEAERGKNTDLVLQDVKNAVDQISSFPADLEPPVIFKEVLYTPAYSFSISGDMDLRSLKKYARIAEDELLDIDGISKIELEGFPEEEIEISFREQDMRALNITFAEAVSAISQNNLLTTGGTIKTAKEELLIRAKNKNYYSEELYDIVILNNPNGGKVKLHQIAEIRDKWVDNPNRSYINGEPGVIVNVFSARDEDMFQNSDLTIEYIKEFQKKYPNVKVKEINDGKSALSKRIAFIKKNGLLGFIIVLILLALFLNIRLAFWVALAIPISFAGMFIAAGYIGITINVITTFGMILVIGILVDDGIVIAENIYQHYERGSSPMKAALDGTMEVLPAVTSAIITTVIAFSSFFFLDGNMGEVFPEMAVVVIFTLIFSLVEGAFILPAHIAHSKALKNEKTDWGILQFINDGLKFINRTSDKFMEFLKVNTYGPLLKFSMKFPLPVLAFCVSGLILFAGALSGGLIKGTFFPNVQDNLINVNVEMPAGSREELVAQALRQIEDAARAANIEMKEEHLDGKIDVIKVIEKNIGPTSYQGNMTFWLLDGDQRENISNRLIIANVKERLGKVQGAEKLTFNSGNAFGEPVAISLLSTNTSELENAVEDFKNELRKIQGITDIEDSNKKGLKEVSLELKPKAENLGLTLGQIVGYVRQGFFGAEVQRLQRGADEVKVWVRYDLQDRSSIKDLADMRVRTASGQAIPLSELVNFKSERGTISIKHIDGQREIRVTADVVGDNVSTSDINNDIQNIILPRILDQYSSVKVGIQGQARDIGETIATMPMVMGLTFLTMFFVIILTFGSVSQAMIVFALIPFGMIGVGAGHYLMGKPMSFLSILGVIALIGIFVNDALVFISTFNSKIREGLAFDQALYETGLSRFRPITLTTLTTVAGLLPILLETSLQAQFLIPMAISVSFGLMVGTFILLVLIPALLVIASRIRLFTTQLWTGQQLNPTMVEPSYPQRQHAWGLTLLIFLIPIAFMLVNNL